MIHPSVKAAFPEHSKAFEGRVPGMYCDILGLITCAQGNLIDPISVAERLPWMLENGERADLAQVRADWHLLKDNAAFYSKRHWKYALAATKCRLTDDAIDSLVLAKLEENATFLQSHYFSAFASFPADAQLGLLSMAWAVGPGFPAKFTNFAHLVLAGNWAGTIARDASGGYAAKIRETNNPGVVPRNKANAVCFANAQIVIDRGLDRSVLYWPGSAKDDTPLPTLPPSAAIDAVADMRAAANRALEMSDPVGLPGQNLRQWEQGDDEPSDPEPRS